MDAEEERLLLFANSLLDVLNASYPLVSPIPWMQALAKAHGYDETAFVVLLNELINADAIQAVVVTGEVRAVIPGKKELAMRKLQTGLKSAMH